jgi:hypothetical protein
MADPLANQHRLYDAQYEVIRAIFDPEDGSETNIALFAQKLREALSDPALSRYYRAEYHILNSSCLRKPELRLERARESLDDMVQVLQAGGRSQEQIDARLSALREMLAIFEERAKDKAEKYANRSRIVQYVC